MLSPVLTNTKIEIEFKSEINMAIINLNVMSYICAYSTEDHICSQKRIFSLVKKCAWVWRAFEMADSKRELKSEYRHTCGNYRTVISDPKIPLHTNS